MDKAGDWENVLKSLPCLQPPLPFLVLLTCVRNPASSAIFTPFNDTLFCLLPSVMGPTDRELKPLKW